MAASTKRSCRPASRRAGQSGSSGIATCGAGAQLDDLREQVSLGRADSANASAKTKPEVAGRSAVRYRSRSAIGCSGAASCKPCVEEALLAFSP